MALLKFLGSLKLTVALLVFSFILIFFATLDQVRYGIYHAQEIYFESFLVFCPVFSLIDTLISGNYRESFEYLRLPLLGGSSLGILLAVNLLAAHSFYFRPKIRFLGITILHAGLFLLILSGFISQITRWEGQMKLEENGSPVFHATNYDQCEVVFVDPSHPAFDTVVAIDVAVLQKAWQQKKSFTIDALSLRLTPVLFLEHAGVGKRTQLISQYKTLENTNDPQIHSIIQKLENPLALAIDPWGDPLLLKHHLDIRGIAKDMDIVLQQRPKSYKENTANLPAVVLNIETLQGQHLGTWLLSAGLDSTHTPQLLNTPTKTYDIALRFRRFYQPFALQLIDFKKEDYPNSNIPESFTSQLHILAEGATIPALIEMNEPLRYKGLTFYQSSFEDNETTSILQVVKNPAYLLPYIGVAMVMLGLCWQFFFSLYHFQKHSEK